jgi:hypothetical protein
MGIGPGLVPGLIIGPGLVPGLILLAGASLAGCGLNDGGGDASEADPFANISERRGGAFGETFDRASRADPYSDPLNVDENDLPPSSATTDPVAVD